MIQHFHETVERAAEDLGEIYCLAGSVGLRRGLIARPAVFDVTHLLLHRSDEMH
jgi:hypothetical protein